MSDFLICGRRLKTGGLSKVSIVILVAIIFRVLTTEMWSLIHGMCITRHLRLDHVILKHIFHLLQLLSLIVLPSSLISNLS
jgi:hypothetical protein